MTVMKAAFVERTGPAETIQVGELPVPAPGPTDVLVQVDAAAVNQVDTYIRAGLYPTPMPFPFIVGRDLTGTVAEAGPGTPFRAGERVWCNSLGHEGRQGSCAEIAVVSAAVQFASEAGARVIATARPHDHERCRELGAESVLDFDDPDLPARVLDLVPHGVDVCWDTSGRADLNALAPVIGARGRVLLTAGRQGAPPLSTWAFYTRDISLVGFVISRATVDELADAAAAINRRLSGGGLPPRIAEVFDLEHTAAAHTRVEARAPGRTVIRVREPG